MVTANDYAVLVLLGYDPVDFLGYLKSGPPLGFFGERLEHG